MKTITFNATIPGVSEELTKPKWELQNDKGTHYVWWLIKEWNVKIEIYWSSINGSWTIEYLKHKIPGAVSLEYAKQNAWDMFCIFHLSCYKGVTYNDLGCVE